MTDVSVELYSLMSSFLQRRQCCYDGMVSTVAGTAPPADGIPPSFMNAGDDDVVETLEIGGRLTRVSPITTQI